MPSVTFLYRIGSNPKVYHGKYVCDYISDDHEGLDNEVLPDLLNGINIYRQKKRSSFVEEKPSKSRHFIVLYK